jgi:tetratricopeptide (TPR) repeat protein
MTPFNPNDALVRKIELALALGHFIRYDEMSDFIEDLEIVKGEIEALGRSDESNRSAELLEVFIAGCREKIEEVDDSGGNLGQFVEDLFVAWIKARQEAKSDPSETVRHLLSWCDSDDYGLCHRIEKPISNVMDEATLQAFREQVETRLIGEGFPLGLPSKSPPATASPKIWKNLEAIKSIYMAQKDEAAYLALAKASGGFTSKDCEDLARINQALPNFDRALEWVNKGLQISSQDPSRQFELTRMKRKLLVDLNRNAEAIGDIWQEFENRPSDYLYQELLDLVPESEKDAWYRKAFETILAKGSLDSVVDFCTKRGEIQTLAKKISEASNTEIEELGSYIADPAAEKLRGPYPRAAARLYLADIVSRLNSKKSKAYPTALAHLEILREIYVGEGLHREWDILVETLRRDHRRKTSFIDDFERIVSGKGMRRAPSFAERIQKRLNTNQQPIHTEE